MFPFFYSELLGRGIDYLERKRKRKARTARTVRTPPTAPAHQSGRSSLEEGHRNSFETGWFSPRTCRHVHPTGCTPAPNAVFWYPHRGTGARALLCSGGEQGRGWLGAECKSLGEGCRGELRCRGPLRSSGYGLHGLGTKELCCGFSCLTAGLRI